MAAAPEGGAAEFSCVLDGSEPASVGASRTLVVRPGFAPLLAESSSGLAFL